MRVAEEPGTGVSTGPQGFFINGKGRFLPDAEIAMCATYRDACALAWERRAQPGLTLQALAALADLYPSHVSDYFQRAALNPKGNPRRSLPADKIADVERVLGNRILSQYLMHRGALTIMEAVLAARNA
ncbi:XRE family transcriptional regulator [Cupriavidus gilardii]|uniref:XRE family transcriptional regulator n=1 Tax=Cupriavidus gilardii TaxID=82541 RepID=UPI001ABEE490|nr:XRE family transcriptional regulator [Cupriavidus gilardii]MBO4120259.1 XRE family transcriptional regulator [Cupriavidus gilardii]